GHLWYLKYPIEGQAGRFITVATTRPETMLGDTAVAVHPDDARYKDLIGKRVILPLANRPIPIIADEHSDPEKGTGAVKITPGHDFNDFEVGKRHKLKTINIFTPDGKLEDSEFFPHKYAGLDRFDARKQIVAELEAEGLVEKVEQITHAVPHDEKTKTVVLEPYLTEQWYLNVTPLAAKAIEAVENKKTSILPQQWEDVYFRWMRNIHPWCISRQLWWGHQIPAWYGPAPKDGSFQYHLGSVAENKIFVAETQDEVLREAQSFYGKPVELVSSWRDLLGDEYLEEQRDNSTIFIWRDPDVLDTWFSSALWPFSTLGWPDETPELKRYYPTSVLVTGFDIIFFWVARMMMMGIHFMDNVPFHKVFIHTRVLDEKGVKMSKTKGNVVDPIDLVDTYGADALRFTLALAAGTGRDMRIGPSRVEINRNFATKLWNAARFCEMNGCETRKTFNPAGVTQTVNKWIVAECAKTAAEVTAQIEDLRFNDAAGAAYRFVWDVYCDWYLELIKPLLNGTDEGAKAEARMTAAWTRDQILKLLHPFMPFITEELWARTAEHADPRDSALIVAPWPELRSLPKNDGASAEMNWVIDLVKGVRSVRAEMNVPPSAKIALVLKDASAESRGRLDRHLGVIATLARLSEAKASDTLPAGSAQFVLGEATVALPLGDVIDFAKERARLEKELKKAEDEIARFDAKLNNEQFVSRAPEDVLAEQREKRAEAAALARRLSEAISRLN
ncbi:MAG TPA: valine--tRNA ligase, partial [Rhizomicrobium sp.]|nr:valine--tRNA ligase [Rhizomicrobium sp.]